MPTIILIIGIYGILGKDKCAQNIAIILKRNFITPSIGEVSGFDITLGVDMIFFGMVLILFAFIVCLFGWREDKCAKCYRALVGLIIFFLIPFVLAFIVLIFYSFITTRIYSSYNMWKREVINCISPVFYIAFAYLTIQYIILGLIVIAFIALCVIAFAVGVFYPNFFN